MSKPKVAAAVVVIDPIANAIDRIVAAEGHDPDSPFRIRNEYGARLGIDRAAVTRFVRAVAIAFDELTTAE